MSHWHDTMVDRPESDGAAYVTGWTVSGLALQLPFQKISESMGNHDSQIVDAGSVN